MASRIKLFRQERADLKREGEAIFAAAGAREDKCLTETEAPRIDAINARLEQLQVEIAREEKFLDQERAQVDVERAVEHAQRATRPSRYAAEGGFDGPAPFGEFFQSVAAAGGAAIGSIPRGTVDTRLLAAATGGSATVSGEGGFLIRPTWSDILLRRGRESSRLYPRCTVIPIGAGSDSFEAPYLQMTDRSAAGTRFGGIQVYRRAEAADVTATKIDQFKKFELRLEDLMGLGYVTDRLLQDAVALQAFIEDAFASAMGFKLDDELVRGTGAGQCLGVLNAPCLVTQAKETGQAADTFVAENAIQMMSRMRPRNIGGSAWYINSMLYPQLPKMSIAVGTAGQLVYMPSAGISGPAYGTLFGRPVEPLEHCSAPGDVGDVIFADYGDYIVIEKGGLEVADSIHVRFIYGERVFRFMWRNNGQPKEPAAITPYKGTDTMSAFVTLAAR